MRPLLDGIFCFPADPLADRQFVQTFLDTVRLPVLVVDRKIRPQLTNTKYDGDIGLYTARLSRETRRRHMKTFAAQIEPYVVSCLKHGRVEIIPRLMLPISRTTEVDVAICPGEIQGTELAFVIGLAPQRGREPTRDTVLRTLVDSTIGVVVVMDASGRFRMLNPQACEVFQQREEDLVGKRLTDVNPSGQGRVLERQLDYFLTNRRVSIQEAYPVASAKLGVIPMRLAVWPLVDGDSSDGLMITGKRLAAPPQAAPRDDWWVTLGKTADEMGPPSFFTHVDGRVVFMSLAARTLLEELTEKAAVNIIKDLPWSDPLAVEGLYRMISGGTPFLTLLAGLQTREGRRQMRLMAFGLKDVGDIVSQVFIQAHDVSETEAYRKMMADTTKTLAAEKEVLEKTADLLDLPVALVDSDLVVRRINGALAKRVRVAPEAAVGKQLGEIVASVGRTGAADYIKRSISEGKEIHLPRFEHVTRDGVKIPMESHFYPMTIEGKRGCLVIVKELVEQERLQNEAARWAQMYKAVAYSTKDGVVVQDKDGLLVDYNPVVAEVMGSKEAHVGRSARELITIDSNRLLDPLAAKSIISGKPMSSGVVKMHREGDREPVFMEISFVPLVARDRTNDGLVAVINYSTTVRNLEEQVRDYTDNLRKMVEERTSQLSLANAALGHSAERMFAVAASGMVLSSLKDSSTVFDTFLGQVREILRADYARLAVGNGGGGAARTAYFASGETPLPGTIPFDLSEQMTAQGLLGSASALGAKHDPRVLLADLDLPDAKGLLLAWRREGGFDPVDASLTKLLATQLASALRITAYISDQRRDRDRADCLRRIAVGVAGTRSVGDALKLVAKELATVIPADRFLWLVRSSGDQIYISEIYSRRGPVENGARHVSLDSLGEMATASGLSKGGQRKFCQSVPGAAAWDDTPPEKSAMREACPFACGGETAILRRGVRQLLGVAGLLPAGVGSAALAPVRLAEDSWGLLCAVAADTTATSCRDACFMCLAASTVGYVWQAADTASALRRLEVAGETVSDLAHDLKYPLLRISDSLEKLVASGSAAAAPSESVEQIRGELTKLMALTRELTEVANPGSRKPEIVDLREVVNACISLVSSDLAARSIVMKNDVGQAPPVFADRRDIIKIALGIVANAVDAIGKSGTITVASRVNGEASGGKQAGLVFRDSGPGVAAGDIDKVFNAFYTTKKGGSGLGLFSAKKRARANGGDITCEVDESGKASFVVMLPVAAA